MPRGRNPKQNQQGELQHGLRYKLSEMANHLLLRATEAHPQFTDPQEHLNFIIYSLFGTGQPMQTASYAQPVGVGYLGHYSTHIEEQTDEEDTHPRETSVSSLDEL